jgi:hypothetical protein
MEESEPTKRKRVINTVVTSRTTRLEMPDDASKQDLIRHFKSQGYLLPTQVSNKTLYTAALALKNKIPLYVPLVKDVVAHDYNIKSYGYEIKPEVARVMQYANLPGDAVKAITEQAVYNQKGIPLWCEGSKVDLHYYLMLLQYIDPKIYMSLKGSTEVTQHVLLLDRDAVNYYKVQKKVGKQLERIRCDAVKLRSIKNDASDQIKSLLETTSFCQSQIVNYVQMNGGLDKISDSVMEALTKISDYMGATTASEQLKDAAGYYKNYAKVNRVSLTHLGMKVKIDEECPPPLQESELPMESFDSIADRLIDFLRQGSLQTSTPQEIGAGMPAYGYLVYPDERKLNPLRATKANELVERATRYIRSKKPIPLDTLKRMLEEKIWYFDVTSRCFVATEDWPSAPRIPPAICFQFTASEEGSKLIKKSLNEGAIRSINPADYFSQNTVINSDILESYGDSAIMEEITSRFVKEASLKKEKSKIVNTANMLVDASLKSAVEELEADKVAIRDILTTRRKTLLAAFPPISRIQSTISEKLVTKVDEILQRDPAVRESLRRIDPEKTIQIKIFDKVQSTVNTLSLSTNFLTEIKDHAEASLITLRAKLELSNGGQKATYRKAISCVEKMVKANRSGDVASFLDRYEQLAALSLTDRYEPASQSINSAQTAGGQTAGFSEQLKGFEAALNAGQDLQPFADALQRKDTVALFKSVMILDLLRIASAIQSAADDIWVFFDGSDSELVNSFQPISLATIFFGRYLIQVSMEAASYLVEKKDQMVAGKKPYEACCKALLSIFRIACIIKYREVEDGPVDLNFFDDLVAEFGVLAKNKVLEYKNDKAESLEIRFRKTPAPNDYLFASSVLAWLSLRTNQEYISHDVNAQIQTGKKPLNPLVTFFVTNSDAGVPLLLSSAFKWNVKNENFASDFSLLDIRKYFESPECSISKTMTGTIPTHMVQVRESSQSQSTRAVTLASMFVSSSELTLARNLLHNIISNSSFIAKVSPLWVNKQ